LTDDNITAWSLASFDDDKARDQTTTESVTSKGLIPLLTVQRMVNGLRRMVEAAQMAHGSEASSNPVSQTMIHQLIEAGKQYERGTTYLSCTSPVLSPP
jgi:hypothetical protein